jgi:hypothetical protein
MTRSIDGQRPSVPQRLDSPWESPGTEWQAASRRLPGTRVTEPESPLDAERIFRVLAEHGVDYVVIGGLAAATHGNGRATSYAELIPEPSPANLERLAAALRSLKARTLNPGAEDSEISASMLPRATIWQFATPDGGIDVIHEAPGARPFSELRGRALRVPLNDVEVPVVSLDDLIHMKLARGRPVDLADVAALADPDAKP